MKDRLKHTEGGHASDSEFSEEHGQSVTRCRTCDQLLRISRGGDRVGDEKLKLTFIESTEERQYRRYHEGHFCSRECLVEFLEDSEENQ